MTVKATDVAGNLGPASTSTSITIDITAPAKPGTPTLNAANDTGRSATDGITQVTTPTFTGTATAGTTVTLYDGASVVGSTVTATTSYSITSSALTNATHTITVTATDAAGNVSVVSTTKTVTIDTIAPAAPSSPTLSAASDTGKSSTDRITKTTTPIITGTNETKAIVTLYDGATQVGTKTTTATTYSVTSSTLSSGSHTLTATATDIAGNLGPASGGTTITIDTTAPVAASAPTLTAASDTGVSSVDRITKITTPTLTGTAEDGVTVGLFDGVTASGAAVTATGGAYTATTATLTTGSHTITAVATDVAGNVGPASPSTSVTIDTTAPTVTINQAAGQADPTTASPINFTAVFSESVYGLTGSGVTLTGTATATTATLTGGGTTFNVAVSGMTKTGTVIPKVAASAAQDVAGNLNGASTTTDSTVTYTDTTAPTVAISSFAPGASQSATVSGTAGFGPGDNPTVTVVLCTPNVYPCAGGKHQSNPDSERQRHDRRLDGDVGDARHQRRSVCPSHPDRPHRQRRQEPGRGSNHHSLTADAARGRGQIAGTADRQGWSACWASACQRLRVSGVIRPMPGLAQFAVRHAGRHNATNGVQDRPHLPGAAAIRPNDCLRRWKRKGVSAHSRP